MARDFDRQIGEPQARIALLNGHIALGIPVPEAVGSLTRTKANPGHLPACATEPVSVLTSIAAYDTHVREVQEPRLQSGGM